MRTRYFLKAINQGRSNGIISVLWKEKVWHWFIKDSVKEIEGRLSQTEYPSVYVIEDYLNECRPFLSEIQITDLSNHLMDVFGVDESEHH